jgi:very-short-patch-repair endonuclease
MESNMPAYRVVVNQKVDENKIRRAKEMRRAPTAAEAMLWRELRANRFLGLRFRRQQVIDGFIVDFYCHAAGVVIELDGAVHEERQEYDAERDQILGARGLTILRFKNEDVRDHFPDVMRKIAEACALERDNSSDS